MINLDLDENSHPTLKFIKDTNLTIEQISIILFYLESGVYSELLKKKVQSKVSPDTYNKIALEVNSYISELNKNYDKDTLIVASTPIISPLQE